MTIRVLVDATPPPPDDAEPGALLEAFEVMFAARQEILARIDAIAVITAEDRELVSLLGERQAAWADALARARTAVSHHRLGARQLRSYGRAL